MEEEDYIIKNKVKKKKVGQGAGKGGGRGKVGWKGKRRAVRVKC